MMKKYFQIAIDGTVASGKGTLARKLADRLGFLYVDTGATYRVATLLAVRANLDFELLDQQQSEVVAKLTQIVSQADISMHVPIEGERDGRLITVKLNGEDVSWAIREESVSAKVFIVAKIPSIREVLVAKQQAIASECDVVMEGRDITYRVLPEAQLKIYLDASQEVRVARRIDQLISQGLDVDKAQVEADLKERDYTDMNRASDPLKIVPDAWVLDTSKLSIDQTVDLIQEKIATIRSR